MSVRQVVHHVDYRSKAEDRKRELEKLQQKGLAKTKGMLDNVLWKSFVVIRLV